ncbi:ABC transporter substrate-binding protein [Microbacterium horticulturae]|uniref:ABC transporter substrate-binding protein n=1 Tax=Microbacterium horticulturae TaxID=3028316 RepID=A0ABY8C2S3_9MICO|nr:ABC transporter substrate-binding protein [Microbacterium sp. KACC 23027]WEG09525.1 ABC transporter substrate-binding protein [Microbacterium sp. KACC 23027]
MKKGIFAAVAAVGLAAIALTGCSSASGTSGAGGGAKGDTIKVGFSQEGAESGWRTANTKSLQEALSADNGFKLTFSDAQQKQENQIAAIRSFITQGVDAIVFAPVVETGWTDVLKQAKQAGIPVILEDRDVDADDQQYITSRVGDDFEKEGETACTWITDNFNGKGANMVVLEGTAGSSAANDRTTGCAKAMQGSDINILDQQDGNFTRAQGKTVMEGFLQKYGEKINVLFAQNDDMGLGALDAIKAAGLTPGKDIQIVTVDGTHDGLTAVANGEFNYVVECNPLLGDQVAKVVKDVVAGTSVDKLYLAKDEAFDQAAAKTALPDRKY